MSAPSSLHLGQVELHILCKLNTNIVMRNISKLNELKIDYLSMETLIIDENNVTFVLTGSMNDGSGITLANPNPR